MSNKNEGFFEGLMHDIELAGIIEASKNKNGKPDPYKAAGIAAGLGHSSFDKQMRLGAILGSQGAFDKDDD